METLLYVDDIGKKYARSMRQSLNYGLRDALSEMTGRSRSKALRTEEFWALQGVSFSISRGECLAVLGGNGAGKSTLLKVISGMLLPDGGHVERRGRMEKMIELSGGFSPHLTGRENVTLRARMLGLTASQFAERMEQVAEFAGLNEFMDTPVQFYSSGMRSRLGFALSVVMKPDILLIDEVLAVGDLGFRMKCYERVDEMRMDSAVLMVTHSMNHVARMATSVLVLNKGKVVHFGDVQQGIAKYHEFAGGGAQIKENAHRPELIDFSIRTPQGELSDGDSIEFGTQVVLHGCHSAEVPLTLSVILGEVKGNSLMDWNSKRSEVIVESGIAFSVEIGALHLCPGRYQLTIVGFAPDGRQFFLSRALTFKITGDYFNSIRLQPMGTWSISKMPAA